MNRGALERLQIQTQIAQAEGALARRSQFPEVKAWAGYRLRSEALADGGDDFISLGVSIPLSLDYGGSREAEIRGAHLRALAAEERYDGGLRSL